MSKCTRKIKIKKSSLLGELSEIVKNQDTIPGASHGMANICRICMEVAEDMLPLVLQNKSEQIELLKTGTMYEDCLGIEVLELPDFLSICMGCKIQLTYYYDFKKKALSNHTKLLNVKKILDTKSNEECQVETLNEETEELDEDVVKSTQLNDNADPKNDDGDIKLEIRSELGETTDYDVDIEYLEDDLNQLDFNEDVPGPIADDPEDGNINLTLEVTDMLQDDCEDTEYKVLTDQELMGESNYETAETDDSEYIESNLSTLKNISSKSTKRRKYQCEICGKKFRNHEIYSGHLNVHQGLPAYCCDICTKEFKFKVNYDYHMKNHNNARSFQCSVCTKSCLSKWDLKVHMRSHTDVRPFNCEICGKGFRVRSHMTDHMETHNEQNTYECPTCLQKYKTKASLKMHITTVHIKATQYPCTICKKVFYRNHHLKIHQKIHMRITKKS